MNATAMPEAMLTTALFAVWITASRDDVATAAPTDCWPKPHSAHEDHHA